MAHEEALRREKANYFNTSDVSISELIGMEPMCCDVVSGGALEQGKVRADRQEQIDTCAKHSVWARG